ncbi:hypothetical protein [Streptomyces sp. NPDC050704]|uniref:hypothetical protein n=1 Tax=Streptomyces sp. NPDC050704 TaxID=3157219 RepID=UPI003443C611
MLSTPEVKAWSNAFLTPLRCDPRLMRTLQARPAHDANVSRTAAALDVAPVTVRTRLRAAGPLNRREPIRSDLRFDSAGDLPDGGVGALAGVRSPACAVHAATGGPDMTVTRTAEAEESRHDAA